MGIKVVSGEDSAALTGGGLACPVPYDLDAIRAADLVIIPHWRDPAAPPPPRLLEALRAAHANGGRVAGLCSGAFVLADSPAGLLGWNAQLMAEAAMGERSLDDDFILDNTTLYWLTNTGGESIRFYYEDAHAPRATEPTTIPLGLAGFKGDFSGVRRFAERDHKNITQWNLHQDPGGHYAAHTEPQVLADDILNFYAKFLA